MLGRPLAIGKVADVANLDSGSGVWSRRASGITDEKSLVGIRKRGLVAVMGEYQNAVAGLGTPGVPAGGSQAKARLVVKHRDVCTRRRNSEELTTNLARCHWQQNIKWELLVGTARQGKTMMRVLGMRCPLRWLVRASAAPSDWLALPVFSFVLVFVLVLFVPGHTDSIVF
jgi:hypothetical protein